jgi:hypothetical protein
MNGEGKIAVDHLYRYEAMPALVGFLEQRLDTTITLGRQNVSPEMAVSLSAAVEDKLRRKCAAEFEVWEAARGA